MARVVVDPQSRQGDRFYIEGDAFHHAVHVLRVGRGDRFSVVDGSGCEYTCVAESAVGNALVARIEETHSLPLSPRIDVHLYCALLKGEKLDLVLQKSVELGVARIGFFRSERSQVRIKPQDEESRRGRWMRIARSAVAQCGGAAAPDVCGPLEFDAMLAEAATAAVAVMPWEGDGVERLPRLFEVLRPYSEARSFAAVVGPEGGFSKREAATARAAGIHRVTLGPRILRAETAALIVPALLFSFSGDVG